MATPQRQTPDWSQAFNRSSQVRKPVTDRPDWSNAFAQDGLERAIRGDTGDRPRHELGPVDRVQMGIDVDEPVPTAVGQHVDPESGLGELGLRFKMSTANNLKEMWNEFTNEYPTGDVVLKKFPGSERPVLAFRRKPTDPWAKLDDDSKWDSEILADVFDFIGQDIGALAGEIGFSIVGAKGATLPKLLAKVASGAFTGDLSQQAIQEARGINEQTGGEQVSQAAGKAAISTAATGVMEPVMRHGGKLLRRGPQFEFTKGGGSMIRTAQKLGLPEPPTHILSNHPWLQRLGRQSAALAPIIRRHLDATHQRSMEILKGLSEGGTGHANLPGQLLRANKVYRNKLLRNVEDDLGFPVTRFATGEKSGVETVAGGLRTSFDEWAGLNKATADVLYARARDLGDPKYNYDALRTKIVKALERNKGAIAESTEEVADVGLVLGPDGVPLTAGTKTVQEEMKVGSGALDPHVKEIYQNLARLTDIKTRPSTGTTATEQLQKWASELAPYMLSDYARHGITKQSHALATAGFAAIKDTLGQVKNTDPKFLAAWKKANAVWSDRMDVLRATADARTSKDLIGYVRSVYKGQATQKLRDIKANLTPGGWVKIKQGYIGDLVSPGNIDNLSKTLNNMPAEFRREMFPTGEDKVLRKFAEQWDEVKRLDVKGRLERQNKFTAIANELVNEPSSAQLKTLGKLVRDAGGLDSALGRNLRSGVIDNIYRRSTAMNEQGVDVIQPERLLEVVKEMKISGAMRFLKRQDMEIIERLSRFEKALAQGSNDMGTSMQAASVSAQLGRLNPDAILSVARAIGWGKLLTSPTGRKILMSTVDGKTTGTKNIAMLAGVLATVAKEDKAASERDLKRGRLNSDFIPIYRAFENGLQ